MDDKFFRDKHNKELFSGTAQGTNSLFTHEIAFRASAYISASGVDISQTDGRASGRYGIVPYCYADILYSGDTYPSTSSNHWFIAQVGSPKAHLMAYDETIVSKYWGVRWIPNDK